MDPFTIITLVSAIVSAVFAATGPILPRLWQGLKRLYGGACQSTSTSTPNAEDPKEIRSTTNPSQIGYLKALGQQRLTNDIHAMMLQNSALRAQANRYYLEGGIRSSQQPTGDVRAGGSGGNRNFIEFSDFSD